MSRLAEFFSQNIDCLKERGDKELINQFAFYAEDVDRIKSIATPDIFDLSTLHWASFFASETTRKHLQLLNIYWSEF